MPPMWLPPADYDDDLSLVGLWRVLMRQWKVILSLVLVCIAAAAGYVSWVTPTYETTAVLLPPGRHHIEGLNIPGINTMTPEDVYGVFNRNLLSNSLRRQFFDDNDLLNVLDGVSAGNKEAEELVFRRRFGDLLEVKQGTRDQKDYLFVSLSGEHRQHLAGWLNDFIGFVAQETVADILNGVQTRITNERANVQEQIEIAQKLAKQQREDQIAVLEEKLAILRDGLRREDRIALLDEQIAIARELGIITRDDAPVWKSKNADVAMSLAPASEPLYLRGVNELTAEKEAILKRKDQDAFLPGVRELTAEIQVLKGRTNDDPFIPGLRAKQEQLAKLDAGIAQFETSTSDVLPARIDQSAITPTSPSSPKKARILALSLVAGLFLGVFAAFQVNSITSSKE